MPCSRHRCPLVLNVSVDSYHAEGFHVTRRTGPDYVYLGTIAKLKSQSRTCFDSADLLNNVMEGAGTVLLASGAGPEMSGMADRDETA